jgi:hypothetical protein
MMLSRFLSSTAVLIQLFLLSGRRTDIPRGPGGSMSVKWFLQSVARGELRVN